MFPQFQPMPLLKRAAPFDDAEWIFELKYDGFRALAMIEHGRAQLISRNGHPFASFSELGKQISDALPKAIIDGEIVCVDKKGKPQFKICCSAVATRRVFSHSISHAHEDGYCRIALLPGTETRPLTTKGSRVKKNERC